MLIPIAYSIFVKFMQSPVLDLGLGHSGSEGFTIYCADSEHERSSTLFPASYSVLPKRRQERKQWIVSIR